MRAATRRRGAAAISGAVSETAIPAVSRNAAWRSGMVMYGSYGTASTSSRPISTSQPAFAMVLGSITRFLFGVMDHTVKWTARQPDPAGGRPIILRIRMGGQAQHRLTLTRALSIVASGEPLI